MVFRDILKKKEKVSEGNAPPVVEAPRDVAEEPPAVFTFLRTDTHTQEIISPPTFSSATSSEPSLFIDGNAETRKKGFFGSHSRSSSSVSARSVSSLTSDKSKPKRLSQRLHLRRSEPSSSSVPEDLPEIAPLTEEEGGATTESQWEKRATMLAKKNEMERSRPTTPVGSVADLSKFANMTMGGATDETPSGDVVATKYVDDNIQEAIRLHEAGDLETATQMFGRLADPKGENNALSQVLYGLALRHGWGCTPNPTEAVTYLSAAASNAASIEELALKAGMKKGGAAKGELVLAIFELANCFRHGWGVKVDKFAAKQYYETAANLGDTDAMNEVAWCYLEGFGCKKDKWASAKYYRRAEQAGSKTLGNTWIWKEKYNEPKK